ncbi:MAG: NAD(P)/FAD-dependent oxidoreductase [Candidatus Dojkabacteria bacterium]
MEETKIHDIAIIGSGPAGYSASIYASRYKLSNIVFGKMVGGTISEAHKVCNYPGVSDVSGLELGLKFQQQAKEQGAESSTESIVDIKKENNIFVLSTDQNKQYKAKTIILATGTDRNKLAIPKEDEYLGKGLSYCATCDAMFYKNKIVGIVGGSNSATMAAAMLSDIAEKTYIIYRGTELRGEPAWRDQILAKKNITTIFQTIVVGLEGEPTLQRVKLSKPYNNSEYLELNGLFIEIGSEPNITLPVKLGLELDSQNYIKVDQTQATSISGIWAAGDCTTNSNKFKQVITAVSEGGIAANSIYCYLKESSC